MKKLFVTLALTLMATAASAADLKETIDRTFDVRPGANVRLSNVNGSITIEAWDQPRVHVLAVKKASGDRDDLQRFMKEMRVEFQQRDGGLVINTIHPESKNGLGFFDWLVGDHVNGSVTYEIRVPRTMNVDVSNTNGGINLDGVTGNHELDTTNGRIEVERCAGSLDASTTNGSINAELVRVTKGQPLRFDTTNGRISIALPRDVAVDVDAGTTNGSIRTDLPIATTDKDRNSLRGTINGGGTRLRARTTNGGIEIKTL
jgi:Putative adhesin